MVLETKYNLGNTFYTLKVRGASKALLEGEETKEVFDFVVHVKELYVKEIRLGRIFNDESGLNFYGPDTSSECSYLLADKETDNFFDAFSWIPNEVYLIGNSEFVDMPCRAYPRISQLFDKISGRPYLSEIVDKIRDTYGDAVGKIYFLGRVL